MRRLELRFWVYCFLSLGLALLTTWKAALAESHGVSGDTFELEGSNNSSEESFGSASDALKENIRVQVERIAESRGVDAASVLESLSQEVGTLRAQSSSSSVSSEWRDYAEALRELKDEFPLDGPVATPAVKKVTSAPVAVTRTDSTGLAPLILDKPKSGTRTASSSLRLVSVGNGAANASVKIPGAKNNSDDLSPRALVGNSYLPPSIAETGQRKMMAAPVSRQSFAGRVEARFASARNGLAALSDDDDGDGTPSPRKRVVKWMTSLFEKGGRVPASASPGVFSRQNVDLDKELLADPAQVQLASVAETPDYVWILIPAIIFVILVASFLSYLKRLLVAMPKSFPQPSERSPRRLD